MSAGLAILLLAAAPVSVASVVDGDGLKLTSGEEIRLMGIDAADYERSRRCTAANKRKLAKSRNKPWCDDAMADRGKRELRRLVARGGVTVERHGVDRYGRTLAHVFVDGRDVGEVLVMRGVVRRWRK